MAKLLDHVSSDETITPTVRGRRRDPIIPISFTVLIDGLGTDYELPDRSNQVSFSKISGIGTEISTTEIIQGSSPAMIEIPIGIKYKKVTFERGVTSDKAGMALMSWYRDTQGIIFNQPSERAARTGAQSGVEGVRAMIRRRRIDITLPGFLIQLIDAWPVAASFGDIDANASEVWIYSYTVAHRGIAVKSIVKPEAAGPTGRPVGLAEA